MKEARVPAAAGVEGTGAPCGGYYPDYREHKIEWISNSLFVSER